MQQIKIDRNTPKLTSHSKLSAISTIGHVAHASLVDGGRQCRRCPSSRSPCKSRPPRSAAAAGGECGGTRPRPTPRCRTPAIAQLANHLRPYRQIRKWAPFLHIRWFSAHSRLHGARWRLPRPPPATTIRHKAKRHRAQRRHAQFPGIIHL